MDINKLGNWLIKRYPTSNIKKVYIEKANKYYVLRYLKKDTNAKLMLYDVEYMEPISIKEYNLYNYECYISHFITDIDYQGQGLGKFLYQLVQAHADKNNLTYSNGIIQPIGDIKDVTINANISYRAEKKFLMLMYHALGNKIINESLDPTQTTRFEDMWEPNTKIAKLNNEQLKYLQTMIDYDKKLNFKTQTPNKGV